MKLLATLAAAMFLAACASSGSPPPTGTPAPPNGPAVDDTHYACGDAPGFLPALLDQPAVAELDPHPATVALRAAIAQSGPDIDLLPNAGYWLVHRDDRSADYLARDPQNALTFISASVEAGPGGWEISGWSQCRPGIVLDGLNQTSWTLDPDAPPPDAATTTFTALVSEMACTSGQAVGARLLQPSITYGVESVLVVFAARPLVGDGFDCQGVPPTRVVVELREPLGNRKLLDAGVFPPAEPVAPAL